MSESGPSSQELMAERVVSKYGRDPLSETPRSVSMHMASGLKEMGIEAKFANPVSEHLEEVASVSPLTPPDFFFGKGKFSKQVEFNPRIGLDTTGLPDAITMATMGETLYLNHEMARHLKDKPLLSAVSAFINLDADAKLWDACGGNIGVLGGKESPIKLRPSQIASLLEFDFVNNGELGGKSGVCLAFKILCRAAGYPIDVPISIPEMENEEIKVEGKQPENKGINRLVGLLGLGKKPVSHDNKIDEETSDEVGEAEDLSENLIPKEGVLKIKGKELLDKDITPEQLYEWIGVISKYAGEAETQMAIGIVRELGVFNFSPRAKANWIGENIEIRHPWFISKIKKLCRSKYVHPDSGTYFDQRNIAVGGKGAGVSIAQVLEKGSLSLAMNDAIKNARSKDEQGGFKKINSDYSNSERDVVWEIIDGLKLASANAIQSYWRRMNGLNDQHETWVKLSKNFDAKGSYLGSTSKGVPHAERIEILVAAVDSLTLSKENATRLAVGFGIKEDLPWWE